MSDDGIKDTIPASPKPASGENPNPNPAPAPTAVDASSTEPPSALPAPSRTPFTNLSQVDADLALARALQEQERAFAMLRIDVGYGGSDYGGSEEYGEQDGDEEEEEDGDDGFEEEDEDYEGHGSTAEEDGNQEREGDGDGEREGDYESEYDRDDTGDDFESYINPADYDGDEAYARALQEAEGGGFANRILTRLRLRGWRGGNTNDNENIHHDEWDDVDPDEYSYEELVALGDVIGTESRGLSADSLASLPAVKYKAESSEHVNNDQCVICRLDYEDGESVVVLSCKHIYHPECISKWLKINRVCPVCNVEVSSSSNRHD